MSVKLNMFIRTVCLLMLYRTAWGNNLKTTLAPEWGVWVNLTYL